MQTKPLYRLIFTTGAALVAAFLMLATPNVRAGLFDVPSEPANWNGPFVAFDNGGVWSNFHWNFDSTTVDLTRQYNVATASPNPNGGAGIPNSATTPNFLVFDQRSHSSDDSGYIAGINLGYNKQIGHFVIGGAFGFNGTHVENKSDFSDTASGTMTVDVNPNGSATPTDVDFDTAVRFQRKIEQQWAGYIGAQAGFAWNRFLIYAIGGAAFSQIDVHSYDAVSTSFTWSPPPPPIPAPAVVGPTASPPNTFLNTQKKVIQNNSIQTGWFAGGGFQYALTESLSAGLEFRHNDFSDTEYHIGVGDKGHSALFPGATTINNDNNEVFFKVSIQLGNLGTKHPAAAAPATQ